MENKETTLLTNHSDKFNKSTLNQCPLNSLQFEKAEINTDKEHKEKYFKFLKIRIKYVLFRYQKSLIHKLEIIIRKPLLFLDYKFQFPY